MPLAGGFFGTNFGAPLLQFGEGLGAVPDVAVHSPADVLAQLIVDLGYGFQPSDDENSDVDVWPVYVNDEPQLPDDCITVYDTTGVTLGYEMRGGSGFDRPGMQVRVRSRRDKDAWTKSRSIARSLNEDVRRTTVIRDGTSYLVWRVSCQPPTSIGRGLPGSRRSIFTMNCTMSYEALG